MTSPRVRFPRLRAAALAAVASGLMLAACEMSTPSGPTPADARRVYAAEGTTEGMQPAELTPRGAVERYYPHVLTTGAGENTVLLFVVSADGRIVEHRRSATLPNRADGRLAMPSLGGLDVTPETIQTVDVMKMEAGRMGPDALSIVWIRQGDAGALDRTAVPTRAPVAGATGGAGTPRAARVTVAGGDEAMEAQPLTPAGARSDTGATQTITVVPTRSDGLPSAASEARTLTLRPTRLADGVGTDVLVVITDAAGNEVHRGAMPPASELNPDMIATIDVRKGAATTNPSGEIHIRLKD